MIAAEDHGYWIAATAVAHDIPVYTQDEDFVEIPKAIIRAKGERASRRFIEFFTASIRSRNTRMAYARAVKQFFDWCDERRLNLGVAAASVRKCTVAGFTQC